MAIRDAAQEAALAQCCYGYQGGAQTGVGVGEGMVRSILRNDNLLAICKCKFKAVTDLARGFTVYPHYTMRNTCNQPTLAGVSRVLG